MPRNPNAGLSRMFRVNQNQFPGVQPGMFNEEINTAIPGGIERQREAATLSALDARTQQGLDQDLEEAEAVRGARDMGFQGQFPMREAADWQAEQKLGMLLAPERERTRQEAMKMQGAQAERGAARDFQAQQGMQDRASREGIAARAQAGQTERAQLPLREKAEDTDGWGNLFGLFGGKKAQAAPATAAAPSASGMIEMIDPADGAVFSVSPSEAIEAESLGAVRTGR